MRKQINSEHAPAAVGPYSQAIETNDLVFISGQLPIDASTGQMADTIEAQKCVLLILRTSVIRRGSS